MRTFKFTPKQIKRFWSKVDTSGGPDACHLWMGNVGKNGYGRYSQDLAHRIAYILTNGEPPPDKPWILHTCDNRRCCNDRHHYAGTVADNNADRVRRGREGIHVSKGEHNGPSKLTAEQVRDIRRAHGRGDQTLTELGEQYGVYASTIHQIVRRKTWAHVH